MNKRRRYLAKRRRAAARARRLEWLDLVERHGICPTCGNHPMNPLPTCPRCGSVPPAGRLTGARADMASWIRRYFHDCSPAPWQVALMVDILAGRERMQLGVDWANGRDRSLVRYQDGTVEEPAPGLTPEQWAAVEARARERSTFGQEPGYPLVRGTADQKADQTDK